MNPSGVEQSIIIAWVTLSLLCFLMLGSAAVIIKWHDEVRGTTDAPAPEEEDDELS